MQPRVAAGFFSKTARTRYTENWGLNRVTQELIDRGRDLTGVTSNLASDFAKYPFGYMDVKGLPVIFANVATVGGHGGAGLRCAELEMGDVWFLVGQSRDLWPDGSDQPPPAVIKAGRPRPVYRHCWGAAPVAVADGSDQCLEPEFQCDRGVKTSPASSGYATDHASRNTSGAVGVGGGITGWNVVGTALSMYHCLQPSELREAGAKYSLMQNKVFLN